MSFICEKCGEISKGKVYLGCMCQKCYNYFRFGGIINEIPPPGVIAKDIRGYVICHICGRAYVRLGSHVRESHHMTIDEYKSEFGLCKRSKTTEANYSASMHNYAYANRMPEQLISSGLNTRIKNGEKLRLNKSARLQEVIGKRRRKYL